VVGREASGIAAGAASLGDRVTLVPDREAAVAVLLKELRPGDAVLVKASRGVALEWVVERIATMGVSPEGSSTDTGTGGRSAAGEEVR
jgi:UDP-N-acetylmuramoyl-tripeptide--D-alanyl-D-alanine ligase